MKIYIFKIILLFIITIKLSAQTDNNASFFIAENPADYEILNRYQQKISSSDKKLFHKFTPWKIIEENTLLSDQFTKAMKVEFEGKQYFFTLNDLGKLLSRENNTLSHIINNCSILEQTFSIIQNKAVLFRKIPFNEESKKYNRTYLEKGTQLKAHFQNKNNYFVQLQSGKRDFGWISPQGRLSLKKSNTENADTASIKIDDTLLRQVYSKIEKANKVYTQLYKKLNASYNQNRPAPFWSMESNIKGVVLQLQNVPPEKFEKSINYFTNEIEAIFAGSSFPVYSTGTAIEIMVK
ncbi:MAG: hypothetical protein D8M58_13410 [Calditrichaeota bacterium]|nr:MAG: hypothetical protein DWQ03_00375 [Calditrichota bacterium]MBL1206396.1 hypothetical protein [Calditrichota bacterium]NOG46222.1 hypothetical protein [Calditrichota bacterium]